MIQLGPGNAWLEMHACSLYIDTIRYVRRRIIADKTEWSIAANSGLKHKQYAYL